MTGTALAAKDTAPTTDLTDLHSFLTNEIDRWRSGSMSQVPEVQAHIGDLARYRMALHNSMEQK